MNIQVSNNFAQFQINSKFFLPNFSKDDVGRWSTASVNWGFAEINPYLLHSGFPGNERDQAH